MEFLINCVKCKNINWLIECKCGCRGITTLKNSNGRKRKYINGHWLRTIDQTRENNNYWKGGRRKEKDYWFLRMPEYFSSYDNGYVLEHVYNYQEYHKCCMLPWGQVHHIDENTDNNRIENLLGVTSSQHTALHNKGNKYSKKDMSDRFCSLCGKNYTYINKIGNPNWYRDGKGGFWCLDCYNRKTKISS